MNKDDAMAIQRIAEAVREMKEANANVGVGTGDARLDNQEAWLRSVRRLGQVLADCPSPSKKRTQPLGPDEWKLQQYDLTHEDTRLAHKMASLDDFDARVTEARRTGAKLSMRALLDAVPRSNQDSTGTPVDVVRRVHDVLGGIDLDPCSSPAHQVVVGSQRFYTPSRDGLERFWGEARNIFMHPPHDPQVAAVFADKFLDEAKRGIVLARNASDQGWWQELATHCLVLMVNRPLQFRDERTGKEQSSRRPSALFFWNCDDDSARRAFDGYGVFLRSER